MAMVCVWRMSALMVGVLLVTASISRAFDVPVPSARRKMGASQCVESSQTRPDISLGEHLHVLHHAGDVESVATLFCEEIGVNINIKTKNTHPIAVNREHYFLSDRYYYNIGLLSLLTLGRSDLARDILSEITSSAAEIYPDTVHMFMRDAFKRGAVGEAQDLFRKHKEVATAMTANVMLEGFRQVGDYEAARGVIKTMEQLELEKDAYTYASLVRMAKRPREIVKVLREAIEHNQVSQPLRRVCIETLGKRGSPEDALRVFFFLGKCADTAYTNGGGDGRERRYKGDTEKSVDALLTALLTPESASKGVHDINGGFFGERGVPAGLVALHLCGLLSTATSDELPGRLTRHLPRDLPVLSAPGPRGYTVLLTYVGSLGSGRPQRTYTQTVVEEEEEEDRAPVASLTKREMRLLRLKVRKVLTQRILAALAVGVHKHVSDETETTAATSSGDGGKESLLPNGRLCDALLRAFSDDVELGRTIWKRDLLPLARKLQRHAVSTSENKTDTSPFLEITEKSFEALMFGSGRCRRPDVGMEIAMAARKCKFGEDAMRRLARAYVQGCRSADFQRDRTTFFQDILDRSADESLRIELGIVEVPEEEIKSGTKIRIQF